MAKFNSKAPNRDARCKLNSAVPLATRPAFSGSLSPKATAKEGLPLTLDSNNGTPKQKDHKPPSGPKTRAKPGVRIHAALKPLPDGSKSPQPETGGSSSCSIAGSFPSRVIPDRQWSCQDSEPGPCTKSEAFRQNLMLKLQPVTRDDWKDCQVPGVRCPWGKQRTETANKEPVILNQRSLPSVTGPAPVKPRRPPVVCLKKYQRATETRPTTAVQSQAPSLFLPLTPDVLQKVRLQAVKCNKVAMLQQLEHDEYDDVEPVGLLGKNMRALKILPPILPFKSGSMMEEKMYDDVDLISDEFPDPPPEFRLQNDSGPSVIRNEKNEKEEEREFRKKFKYEGDIKVMTHVMVDLNSRLKKGSGKDLSLKPGEILEVIEYPDEKKALCRNEDGKYGLVPRSLLLDNIYDDVGSPGTYCNN
ncbi:uncharacterized protein [Heterodontus francisci]|uniref:uncharacterized protein isoform X3 n=1 Tax=Heterodontus francisci TaxID=7792 RepID=UPI00355BDEA4